MSVTELRATLRALRLRQGWSYEQLAEDIHRVNGDRRVSAVTARRFILAVNKPSEHIEYALRAYMSSRKRRAA